MGKKNLYFYIKNVHQDFCTKIIQEEINKLLFMLSLFKYNFSEVTSCVAIIAVGGVSEQKSIDPVFIFELNR